MLIYTLTCTIATTLYKCWLWPVNTQQLWVQLSTCWSLNRNLVDIATYIIIRFGFQFSNRVDVYTRSFLHTVECAAHLTLKILILWRAVNCSSWKFLYCPDIKSYCSVEIRIWEWPHTLSQDKFTWYLTKKSSFYINILLSQSYPIQNCSEKGASMWSFLNSQFYGENNPSLLSWRNRSVINLSG